MTSTPIRVLIADDHPIVRSGIVRTIELTDGMEVIAEAETGTQAVALFCQHQPDVTLMDLRMPEMNGVEAIISIRNNIFSKLEVSDRTQAIVLAIKRGITNL